MTDKDILKTKPTESSLLDTLRADNARLRLEYLRSNQLKNALANLMPFVLEDYYPNCATPGFKAAVEAAKEALKL